MKLTRLARAISSQVRATTTRPVLAALASTVLLTPGIAHALDWDWSFTAQAGSIPVPGLVSGRLLNLTPGNNVSGAGSTAIVVSTPGNAVTNETFSFTTGTFSSSGAGVTFVNARYEAVIGGVPFILFFGSDPGGGTFFPQLFGGAAGVNLFNVGGATVFTVPPPAGIVPGGTFLISDPAVPTTFAGGTLTMDVSGTFTQHWTLGTQATNAIDLAGSTGELSGTFSGAGGNIRFINSGTGGALSLSGTSTYTGSTTVLSGANLRVLGSIASSSGLTVAQGGTVGGIGVLPTTTVASGGVIAPGNSIGTLSVANLDLDGGTVQAEIQGPQSDRIDVVNNIVNFTGTAELRAFGGGNPLPGFSYVLINAPNSTAFATANSLTLSQSGIDSALLQAGTVLTQEVDGNPRTFDVQWRPRNGTGATVSALQFLGQGGVNRLATAGAFDRVFQSLATAAAGNANNVGDAIGVTGLTTGQAAAAGISPEFVGVTSQLLALSSAAELTAAINSISPEPYAAFQGVGLETMKRQRELLLNQAGKCAASGAGAASGGDAAASGTALCFFAQAANATSDIDGASGMSSYDADVFSSFYGLEYRPSQRWSFGVAYGYGTSDLDNMSMTNARVESDVHSGSVYGTFQPTSQWRISGLVGYANFDVNARRSALFIANDGAAVASPSADGYTVALNADYLVNLSNSSASTRTVLKPFAGLAWGAYDQGAFTERGAGPLSLRVQGATANSLVGTLGVELATSPFALNQAGTAMMTPSLTVAYQGDALADDADVRSLNASFVAAPGAGFFQAQGQNRGTHTLYTEGGVDVRISTNTALYANVGYEVFSNGSQFTYGGGGLKIRF